MSFIYSSPLLYDFTMRLLYRQNYKMRFLAICSLIGPGDTVTDFCCGTGELGHFILQKGGLYKGIDLNPAFIEKARKRGLEVTLADVFNDVFPKDGTDVSVIQASLYQFWPNAQKILEKLLYHSKKIVIISEATRSLQGRGNGPWFRLINHLNRVNGRTPQFRFDVESLEKLINNYFAHLLLQKFDIPGARERVYVLRAKSDKEEDGP